MKKVFVIIAALVLLLVVINFVFADKDEDNGVNADYLRIHIRANSNSEADQNIKYEVKVASADMGKVIGKQGKVAKSIRTLMKSLESKEKKTVSIEFAENNEEK